MTVAYIAIGSNLASPLEQVNAALKALGDIPESHILAMFRFTAPHRWPQDQPDYLNAAVALETSLAPEELLNHTQRIELQQVVFVKLNAGDHARWISISCCLVMK